MFNVQGSELIFLLLVALIILGPEKLPDAVRKATKTYAEFKKMANGFQGEMRQVLDEPMRELRDTASAVRDAATFDITGATTPTATAADAKPTPGTAAVSEIAPRATTPIKRDQGLNFGGPNARKQVRSADAPITAPVTAPDAPITASGAHVPSDTLGTSADPADSQPADGAPAGSEPADGAPAEGAPVEGDATE